MYIYMCVSYCIIFFSKDVIEKDVKESPVSYKVELVESIITWFMHAGYFCQIDTN